MNLLETLLQAQGGGLVQQMAQKFGLDESQAGSAISALLPALAGGLQNNISQPGGLDGLLGALTSGNHAKYIDDPSALANPEAVQDGNGILGHLLGSKDASRAVATQAAAQTGIGADILKGMLPMVATMVMGSLSKNAATSNLQAGAAAPGGGMMGMLSGFLDTNKDGSIADDVLGMAQKFFSK